MCTSHTCQNFSKPEFFRKILDYLLVTPLLKLFTALDFYAAGPSQSAHLHCFGVGAYFSEPTSILECCFLSSLFIFKTNMPQLCLVSNTQSE